MKSNTPGTPEHLFRDLQDFIVGRDVEDSPPERGLTDITRLPRYGITLRRYWAGDGYPVTYNALVSKDAWHWWGYTGLDGLYALMIRIFAYIQNTEGDHAAERV